MRHLHCVNEIWKKPIATVTTKNLMIPKKGCWKSDIWYHFFMPKRQVTIPVFIPHLGCRHRCIFCDQWGSTASTGLPAPETIDTLIKRYAPHIKKSVTRIELAFFGGSFTGMQDDLQESFLAAARRHLEAGHIHGIRLSTRPDYISPRALDLLMKYRVSTIELGVQSLDEKVLEAADRGHTTADVFSAVRLIADYGFSLVIQLMPGLPRETRDSALRSALMTADLRPAAVRIYPAVVLSGTGLERLYRGNLYSPLSLDDAVELCKEMYLLFLSRNIPVIRMGLHPFAPSRDHAIVAGPYHPSFGYMVKSRARRDEMADAIGQHLRAATSPGVDALHIVLPDKFKEEYIGHHKDNIRYLERAFNIAGIEYTVGPVSEMRIA
jgi:histone acetyltransferase (RNA polymerase elongator complex component)